MNEIEDENGHQPTEDLEMLQGWAQGTFSGDFELGKIYYQDDRFFYLQ
ncbi:MAG: hypothetical protein ACMUEM_03000 [Flavobacteriales bacterium AspAUS03]